MKSIALKALLVGVALSAVSGCATTIPTDKAMETSARLGTPSQGTETVIVKRGTSIGGSICADRVFADKAPIADLRPGQKVTFQLPAGRHIIGVEKQGMCPGQMRELSVELNGGQVRTFFVDVSVHAEYVFQETTQ